MSIITWNELRNFPRRNLDLRASTELAKVEALRKIAEELHLIHRRFVVLEENNLLLKIMDGALDKNIKELEDRGKG